MAYQEVEKNPPWIERLKLHNQGYFVNILKQKQENQQQIRAKHQTSALLPLGVATWPHKGRENAALAAETRPTEFS